VAAVTLNKYFIVMEVKKMQHNIFAIHISWESQRCQWSQIIDLLI